MLLLAESRALFTVYRTITDAGMRIYQLNRDSQQDITSPPDEVGPLPSMQYRRLRLCAQRATLSVRLQSCVLSVILYDALQFQQQQDTLSALRRPKVRARRRAYTLPCSMLTVSWPQKRMWQRLASPWVASAA